jgi:hypothetical protein
LNIFVFDAAVAEKDLFRLFKHPLQYYIYDFFGI